MKCRNKLLLLIAGETAPLATGGHARHLGEIIGLRQSGLEFLVAALIAGRTAVMHDVNEDRVEQQRLGRAYRSGAAVCSQVIMLTRFGGRASEGGV
jgi:hypothetical protein